MTTATRLTAAVDVLQESTIRRAREGLEPGLRVEPGIPVRVAAFVGRDPSYAQAVRAAVLRAGAELVLITGFVDRRSFVERAVAMRAARPDAVVIAGEGGDVPGMVDLLEALRYARAGTTPRFLLAGEARLHERIAAAQGAPGEPLPDLRAVDGRLALVARLRGLRRRAEPVVLRDEAIEGAARALAAATQDTALVIDAHSASTSLAHATAAGEITAIHTRLGVGAAADRVVTRGGLERVRRWIPRPIDGPALLERVFNRARWPDAVPASAIALSLEMALARETIARALDEAVRCGIDITVFRTAASIACTGRLARLPRGAQTILTLLDGLAPSGLARVSRERQDGLIAAGALAARNTEVELENALEAVAVTLVLEPRRAVTVKVTDDNGPVEEQVGRGALLLIPTTGRVWVDSGAARISQRSLSLGVVIDARGRPLALPPRDAERLPTLARWLGALGAMPGDAS